MDRSLLLLQRHMIYDVTCLILNVKSEGVWTDVIFALTGRWFKSPLINNKKIKNKKKSLQHLSPNQYSFQQKMTKICKSFFRLICFQFHVEKSPPKNCVAAYEDAKKRMKKK